MCIRDRFDYERVSGTLNFSGALGSQTLMIYIYDATAGGANWIQPAGYLGMNQSSGPGRVSCTFQSSVVSGQKYRVAVIASQSVGSACSLEFDNFTCARVTAPIGQLRNPAGTIIATGSLTPPNGYLYCDGSAISRSDYSELFSAIGTTYGTGNGTTTFNIPDLRGIFARGAGSQTIGSITYSATIGTKQNDQMQGHTHTPNATQQASNGTGGVFNFPGTVNNGAGVTFSGPSNDGTNGNPRTGGETRPANQSVAYHICFSSGSVQLSNDTDTRVVAFSAFDGAGVNATNTTVLLPLGNTDVDTHASRSSNTYIVPVSGFYRVVAKSTTRFNAINTSFNHALFVYKNAVVQNGGDYGNADGANSANIEFFFMSINHIFRFNAGDVIDIRYFTNYNGVATTYLKYVSFERLSGPSVIAATETVAEVWTNQAGTALGATGVAVALPFATKVISTHGAWNGSNTFTAPVSGLYQITASVGFIVPTASTAGGTFDLFLNRSGVAFAWSRVAQGVVNSINTVVCSRNVRLNAGETFDTSMRMFWNGATTPTLYNDSAINSINILRVGN